MHGNDRLTWRKWPLAVGILATAFIIFGISLVARTHRLQQNIARQVSLLQELSMIGDDIQELATTHKIDVGSRRYMWAEELGSIREKVLTISKNDPDVPGMAEFPLALDQVLLRADSIHGSAMQVSADHEQQRDLEAILQIMIQRAQKVLDGTARSIYEQGLAVNSHELSARWKEAQMLVVMACMLAVILAWLVAMSNRLLLESRRHGSQLAHAKKELEQTNKELRETMLSKEEKEMMIKEIHHRVKNNLQIVKSLIRFQMDQVNEPKVIELFNECVNRVSAMALVHEQTYLSKDLANIDVNTYLSHLTRDLCQAYTIDTRLQLDIRINVPSLGVDTLIPLGLLINEIISNSLKYAFKGRSEGTIFVHMDGDQQNGLHLRIGDNGVGLPDRSKWKDPKSLGMELIHTLSDQLDASIELVEGPGTTYELSSIQMERQRRA